MPAYDESNRDVVPFLHGLMKGLDSLSQYGNLNKEQDRFQRWLVRVFHSNCRAPLLCVPHFSLFSPSNWWFLQGGWREIIAYPQKRKSWWNLLCQERKTSAWEIHHGISLTPKTNNCKIYSSPNSVRWLDPAHGFVVDQVRKVTENFHLISNQLFSLKTIEAPCLKIDSSKYAFPLGGFCPYIWGKRKLQAALTLFCLIEH